ncbi:unnamed protein product [Protopolystoma xenopodis]|uniref:Uncharacterized protein n=1 Tax=Protopolystoma xenopodis TaxID=117903 RepID=A0A448WME5_9PLAT|nr:unnamed protein product [Protopolystoma xenopodis]
MADIIRAWYHRHNKIEANESRKLLNLVATMYTPCSGDVPHISDKSLAPFHRNRRRLPRKQSHLECSNKANRQLVKRNRPSSSGGTELKISSRNTFTRNGSELNDYETRNSSKPNFSLHRHFQSRTVDVVHSQTFRRHHSRHRP